MNIGQLKRLSRGDITDAPAWMDKVIVLWNQSFEPLYGALARRLNFTDNFQAVEKEIGMKHGEPIVITVDGLKGKVTKAYVLRTGLFSPATWAWEALNATQVRVKVLWTPAATVEIPVLWRFEAEA